MKVIIYFVTVLYVHKLCICEEHCRRNFTNHVRLEADSNKLYLLSSNDEQHKALNNKFSSIAHHLGFSIVNVPEFCSDGLLATKMVMEHFMNAINLKVKITSKIYNLKLEKLKAVGPQFSECHRSGDGIPTDCIKVCKSGHSVKTMDGIDYETCEVTVANMNAFTKVVSDRITQYKILYEILQRFDDHYKEDSYPNWNKVITISRKGKPPFKKGNIVVCTDEDIHHNIEGVSYAKDCERIADFAEMGIIAALAPKPLKGEKITHLPVLFYNISYLLPEDKDKYPNSIVLYNNSNSLLKNLLIEFIEKQQWNRIAIVSDDSPYSDSFETELVARFIKKEVVYSLKQCLGRTCNFNKALNELKEDKARIIVANVGEEYAKQLVETAFRLGMTSKSGVMWIWRGWPFQKQSHIEDLGEVFSLNVMLDDYHQYEKLIEIIKKTLQNFALTDSKEKGERHRYRALTTQIRNNIRNQPVAVKLIKITPTAKIEIFASKNGVTKVHSQLDRKYMDLAEPCSTRSNSFSSPCEDSYPLILLLVIGLFLLAMLIIFLVFQKYTRRPQTYRSLS